MAATVTTFVDQLRSIVMNGGPIYSDPSDQIMELLEQRQLMGNAEIAMYCGVTQQNVRNWQRSVRWPFPEPNYRLAGGPLWWLDELSDWLSTNRNLLGVDSDAVLALSV